MLAFAFYDPMEHIISFCRAHECSSSLFDVAVFEWTDGQGVFHMPYEGVHAVAFGCDADVFAFRDQLGYLFHHQSLVFCYLFGHLSSGFSFC